MTDQNLQFEAKCKQASCRSCGQKSLLPVLDLGLMPLSDGLLTQEQLRQSESLYPLEVAFCSTCSLVQILETVPPDVLFGKDYPYFSSFSQTLLEHSRHNALNLIAERKLAARSFVVEIASNDGYLLKNFVDHKIPVLGIDPAPGPAAAAERIGVSTLCAFFGKDLAERLSAQGKRADVIIANNVLAHVADTNGLVAGMRILVKENGIVVVECPYVRDLIDHCEFDTIYHEHLCYFSVTSVDKLFRRYSLYLNHVERLAIHGGSLRLYLEPRESVRTSVKRLLAEERSLGVDTYAYYQAFSQKVSALRDQLQSMMRQIKSQNRRIAAYGAAAKGAILLNYIGAGQNMIDFVVDRNVHKQGKFMPGVHIPIHAPQKISQAKPDYLLVLPWNFKEEILSQQTAYRQGGGQFIIPIPTPQVI